MNNWWGVKTTVSPQPKAFVRPGPSIPVDEARQRATQPTFLNDIQARGYLLVSVALECRTAGEVAAELGLSLSHDGVIAALHESLALLARWYESLAFLALEDGALGWPALGRCADGTEQ